MRASRRRAAGLPHADAHGAVGIPEPTRLGGRRQELDHFPMLPQKLTLFDVGPKKLTLFESTQTSHLFTFSDKAPKSHNFEFELVLYQNPFSDV